MSGRANEWWDGAKKEDIGSPVPTSAARRGGRLVIMKATRPLRAIYD